MKTEVPTIEEILDTPPCGFAALVESLPNTSLQNIEDRLAWVAYRATIYSKYIGMRHGYGCGDQGHASANKAARKAGNALWCKIFGYNAPLTTSSEVIAHSYKS